MDTRHVLRSAPHRPFQLSALTLREGDNCWIGSFEAMACPCEILLDTADKILARELLQIGADEAWRIEKKYSRYVHDNIVHRINNSNGETVIVDEETARLIDFADRCYRLSEGLFDVTSGVLRRAWKFDGSDRVPPAADVEALRSLVGWEKVEWKSPTLRLRPGMELDLGGIGKEYAVDRALLLIRQRADIGALVNFGGDIAVGGVRRNNQAWTVGIEEPTHEDQAVQLIRLEKGALATSGDSRKFVMVNGKRYGHILDPRNGWPVPEAPRSVTVAAGTCTEAGFLSTYGILSGKEADAVLSDAGVPHWCH